VSLPFVPHFALIIMRLKQMIAQQKQVLGCLSLEHWRLLLGDCFKDISWVNSVVVKTSCNAESFLII
jgi:hypothetical protein